MTRRTASRSAAAALLALGALTGAVSAQPVELAEAQMDKVSAGAFAYDSAGNLYDAYGFAYTYDPASGRYQDGAGVVWKAPYGIHYHDDGYAYGFLWNGKHKVAWDGGIVTIKPSSSD